ncbi:class II lanthipeptide, LchA2/BrtA2 family [Staphylospora marina]|uniref:class II lanthipeptide, LchA2/BrtA2 family n=1 Tax=Staphylospora marina TaxID=2490858 RepID=UPI000F5BADB5|nr:class II lanthipeptide, LchA2/BrtA2 family [Staphylospora marina]
MSMQERALRDPKLRFEGFEHPAGMVNEDELMNIVGAGEVRPQSGPVCAVTLAVCVPVSLAFCPTTACTSDCR